MRHFRATALWLIPSCLMAGCTFDDGSPWGTVEGSVSAELEGTEGRTRDPVTAEAVIRLRTSHDYALEIRALSVDVDDISATQAGAESSGESVSDFDPSNPPAGYTLCHNGHCHADSGELVPYEEIAGDSRESSSAGSIPLMGEWSADLLVGAPELNALQACSTPCVVGPDNLAGWSASVHSVVLDLTVEDLRTGDASRTAGGELALIVPLETTVEAPGDIAFPYHGDNRLNADIYLSLDARFVDAVDWAAALSSGSTPTELIAPAIAEHLSLGVDVSRSALP